MKPPEGALYFDPICSPPVWVGDASPNADSFYYSHRAVTHWDGGQRTYRVMIRCGCSHDSAQRAILAYVEGHPELSFRDCMVNPPPPLLGEDDDHCSATRADPSYASLRRVLDAAFAQSAEGKGKARHGNGLDFDQQPIMKICRMVGAGYPVGQAMKKGQEAIGMARRGEHDAAKAELLGVIVYAAAAYLLLEEGD